MAGWRPLKRRDFVSKLRGLGFEGPFAGTRHEYMVFQGRRQTIPSNAEYSVPQIRMIVRQIEVILGRSVTADEWEQL